MPTVPTPQGITPPAPGLDHEEPAFVPEDDIPSEGAETAREERPAGKPERK